MSSIPDHPDRENESGPEQGGAHDTLPLILRIDSDHVEVPPSSLAENDQQQALVSQYRDTARVQCDLTHLLQWSPRERSAVFAFSFLLSEQCDGIRFRGPGSSEDFESLFSAVVAAIQPNDNPDECERAIEAALEAGAVCHTNSLRPACSRLARALRSHGLPGYPFHELLRRAQEHVAASQDREEGDSASLNEIWSDAPVTDGMVMPSGWYERDGHLYRTGGNVPVIAARLAIVRRLSDLENGTHLIELAWQRFGAWQRRVFPRSVVAAKRSIVGLADFDIPVHANNAGDVIDYLDALEAVNFQFIPEAVVSDRMGWIGDDGANGFLVGRRLINESQLADTPTEELQQAVEFRGSDAGDEQLASALHSRGTYQEWASLIQQLQPYPKVMLAVYASFVPPVLSIFRTGSFIVSWAGPTSEGKTSTLSFAAATWGCPDEQAPESYMMTWDTTRVGIERSMRLLTGLPICVDDTKQARSDEDISQTVYDVAGGRGRTRGSERGLAATGSWRTVMLTTGEAPMASFTEEGGTRARILELWSSPFGETSQRVAELITELRDASAQNYGHAGPRFVAALIANRHQWDEWRDRFRAAQRAYTQRAENNVATRMAAHFAALETTANLVHELLELPWPYTDVVSVLWEELTSESAEADRAAAALRTLLNRCHAEPELFIGSLHRPGTDPPPGRCWGVWRQRIEIDGEVEEYLAVYVSKVNELLKSEGFDSRSTKRTWRDRGWTLTNENKTTRKIRPPGASRSIDAVVIPERVISESYGEQESPQSPPPNRGRRGVVGAGNREQENNMRTDTNP